MITDDVTTLLCCAGSGEKNLVHSRHSSKIVIINAVEKAQLYRG
jgi:hypothetical protein